MIYKELVSLNPKLSKILYRALKYLDDCELTEYDREEARRYVEQDVLFVAEANIPDYILSDCNIKFHYTDQ